MNKKAMLALMGITMLGSVQSFATQYTLSEDIYADTTWTSGNEYILTKPIFVTNNATLTIQSGVVVRGEQEVSTDPGALIISRGSKIKAMGTSAAPIVFTDMNDDNIGANYGTGAYGDLNNGICKKWGGVLLLGKTYIASAISTNGATGNNPDPRKEMQIEGLEPYGEFSKYGGGDDDDDSGEMHFCSIRYGGFVLGDANEINGLTMGCVGRATDIDHIEVFQNKDDAFEWFGGTVNCKYLVAWCVADDSFDYDEGFRGKGQFWFVMQGPLASESDVSDKGSEQDGATLNDAAQPSSIPTIYNATMVGQGRATDNKKNTALHFRDGSGGRWFNGLFLDFGGAPALIEGDIGGGYDSADQFNTTYTTSPYYTHETAGTRKGDILNSTFWKFGTNEPFACIANTNGLAGVWGAEHNGVNKHDGNKAHYGFGMFGSSYAYMKNQYLDGAQTSPVKTLTRSATPVTISSKNYYPVEYIEPIINTTAYPSNMVNGRVPPGNDSFFTPVAFRGAFADEKNWAGPWSCASRLGMLDAPTDGDYSGIKPDIWATGNSQTVGNNAVDGSINVPVFSNIQVKATLNSDVYVGNKADYFIVCEGPNHYWYWYSVASGKWRSNFACSLQNSSLGNYGEAVLFNSAFPFPGTYKFYYIVELQNNGVWDDAAPYVYDTITVNVMDP